MKLLMLMAFCILSAATCKNGTNSTKVTNSEQTSFIDAKGKHYRAFGDIPDSLRTPEQKKYFKSLQDVLVNGVVVENNHMVLKFNKEECLAKGMSEKDYNELQKNLRDNNHFFDSTGVKNVAAMIDNMHRDMKSMKTDR